MQKYARIQNMNETLIHQCEVTISISSLKDVALNGNQMANRLRNQSLKLAIPTNIVVQL
jgi:hypothetical protein